jgi:hypothetical protein
MDLVTSSPLAAAIVDRLERCDALEAATTQVGPTAEEQEVIEAACKYVNHPNYPNYDDLRMCVRQLQMLLARQQPAAKQETLPTGAWNYVD